MFLLILLIFHEQLFHGITFGSIKLLKKDTFDNHKRVKAVLPISQTISKNIQTRQKEAIDENLDSGSS